jgi:hypothetical protein
VDFQKLLPVTINLPEVFATILGHFGAGLGVWGEGLVLDPLSAGKSAIYKYQAPTAEPDLAFPRKFEWLSFVK